MTPTPEVEAVQASTAAARILCAVKENRIELIGIMILAHLLGLSDRVIASCESVAPWLCECEEISAAQSSLQQTKLYIEKPKKTIRILVPKMSERQRREAKAAMLIVKPNNRQERF